MASISIALRCMWIAFIVVRSTGPDTPFPVIGIERAVRHGRIDGHDIVVTGTVGLPGRPFSA